MRFDVVRDFGQLNSLNTHQYTPFRHEQISTAARPDLATLIVDRDKGQSKASIGRLRFNTSYHSWDQDRWAWEDSTKMATVIDDSDTNLYFGGTMWSVLTSQLFEIHTVRCWYSTGYQTNVSISSQLYCSSAVNLEIQAYRKAPYPSSQVEKYYNKVSYIIEYERVSMAADFISPCERSLAIIVIISWLTSGTLVKVTWVAPFEPQRDSAKLTNREIS